MHQQLTATRTALLRNRAARNRHQVAKARHDMRTWQVERRKRTRHLIELGGLVVKAGIVDLTGDDRATIFGALLWMRRQAQKRSGRTGTSAVGRDGEGSVRGRSGDAQRDRSNCSSSSSLTHDDGMSAERPALPSCDLSLETEIRESRPTQFAHLQFAHLISPRGSRRRRSDTRTPGID